MPVVQSTLSGLRGLAAAALVAVSGSAGLLALSVPVAPPAAAAACSGDSGVTVVVDYKQLGDGVQGTCVANGGGKSAANLFPSAGFALRYAQRQPGFVCRVNDKPASDPCVNTAPADAYWSLWWSRGDAGSGWTYASEGVSSLNIPDGGLVAFSWDQQSGNVPPNASPQRPSANQPAPSPSPSPNQPSQPPSGGGNGGGSGGGSGGSGAGNGGGSGGSSDGGGAGQGTDAPGTGSSASPGASPTDGPSGSPSAAPSDGPSTKGSPSASPSGSATPTPGETGASETEYPDLIEPSSADSDDAADDGSGSGLPGWVPPLAVGGVLAGAGGALVLRRRLGAGGS